MHIVPDANRDITPAPFAVVGDVHGCIEELESMLRLLDGRQVILTGDLVGKGPASEQVVRRVRKSAGITSVMGNADAQAVADPEAAMGLGLSQTDVDFLRDLPLHAECGDVIVVHGGCDPTLDCRLQQQSWLLRARRCHWWWDDERAGTPWHSCWQGPPRVAFGHWPRQQPLHQRWVIGLDTGCVYGGWLSAWLWPEDTIIRVPARRVWCAAASKRWVWAGRNRLRARTDTPAAGPRRLAGGSRSGPDARD